MLFASAIASALFRPRHVQLRVGPSLRLPLRAAGVVVPAREAPAVPESLAPLVLELVPGPGNAEAEAVALRLLVVTDPVVGGLAVRLPLVDHAARGAVLVEGDAVGGEDAGGNGLDPVDVGILALELQLLRPKERLQPGLEQPLVLLQPEAVVLGQLVAAVPGLRLGIWVIAADEVALVDVDRRFPPLQRDRVADVADQPVVAEPAGVVAHAHVQEAGFVAPLPDRLADAEPLHRPCRRDVLVSGEELLAVGALVLASFRLDPDVGEDAGIAHRLV